MKRTRVANIGCPSGKGHAIHGCKLARNLLDSERQGFLRVLALANRGKHGLLKRWIVDNDDGIWKFPRFQRL